MPAIDVASAHYVSSMPKFGVDIDDDDFGDFAFVSPASVAAGPKDRLPEDYEWGDFVATPLGSCCSPPEHRWSSDRLQNSEHRLTNGWEKPREALPLSFFEEDDAQEEENSHDLMRDWNLMQKRGSTTSNGVGLKDLVAGLYPSLHQGNPDSDGANGYADNDGQELNDTSLKKAEKKSDLNGGEFQISDDRSHDLPKLNFLPKMSSNEQSLDDFFVTNDNLANGLTFGIDLFDRNSHSLGNILEINSKETTKVYCDGENNHHFKANVPSEHQGVETNNVISIDGSTSCTDRYEMDVSNHQATEARNLNDFSKVSLRIGTDLGNVRNSLYSEKAPSENGHTSMSDLVTASNGEGQMEKDSNDVEVWEEDDWEFQAACETFGGDHHPNADKYLPYQFGENPILDIYKRLKDYSLCSIVNHLENFEKAHEVATLSGEKITAVELENKKQMINRKLQEHSVMKDVHMCKHKINDEFISHLSDILKESIFVSFEREYQLSRSLLLAPGDFNEAIKLLDHATSVSNILSLASIEGQKICVSAWSKMAFACLQELKHGYWILRESFNANISEHILSRAGKYFVSLGEIYRVVEILRTTSEFYKPWMLMHDQDSLLRILEECIEIWSASRLEEALKSLSENPDADLKYAIKQLLESMRSIQALDHMGLDMNFLNPGHGFCSLSLLPFTAFPGMQTSVWDGNEYLLKLANLWASLVSRDPPRLSRTINIGLA